MVESNTVFVPEGENRDTFYTLALADRRHPLLISTEILKERGLAVSVSPNFYGRTHELIYRAIHASGEARSIFDRIRSEPVFRALERIFQPESEMPDMDPLDLDNKLKKKIEAVSLEIRAKRHDENLGRLLASQQYDHSDPILAFEAAKANTARSREKEMLMAYTIPPLTGGDVRTEVERLIDLATAV